MRRAVRVLVAVAAVVSLFVVAAVAYLTWTVRRSFPQLEGSLHVPGLSAPVDVLRDRYGIPQVYADTPEDLFLAQGFIHAQDRFWEMDLRRQVTAGRLAELFGEDQVETDRFVRTLGWRRVAQQELALLEPQTRRYLDSYSQGVNAYLRSHDEPQLSLEHALLGLTNGDYVPEPWTPVDSLAWLKAMAWDLRTNMEREIERAVLARDLPVSRVEQLFPEYPFDRQAPVVSGDDLYAVRPPGPSEPARNAALRATAPGLPDAAVSALAGIAAMTDALPPLLGRATEGVGSNAWAVSGAKTASGRPLLANDPHLSPALPSVWYQMGLHCREPSARCPFDVAGFTFSGFPGVVIGHNDRVAWGFTNMGADVTDLYVERVREDEYLVDGVWQPLTVVEETIDVAGGDPVPVRIRSTPHGPLVSDANDDLRDIGADPPPNVEAVEIAGDDAAAQYAVALRWTALDPGGTADAVFAMNAASDWVEFRDAARSFEVPAQNLVYADVDGNIGYQAPGRIPVRGSGDGRWPVPGWISEYDWTGWIPFEELPSVLNPAEGMVISGNQAVAGADYPYLLTADWPAGYRSERIRALLTGGGNLTTEDMVRIQTDSADLFAPELLDHLRRVPDLGEYYGDGQRLLRDWNGEEQAADSAAAAYYNAVWRNLLRLTFHDELPEEARPDGGDRWYEVMRTMLTQPANPYWDDVTTDATREERDDVLRQALIDARDELTRLLGKDPASWEWGRIHRWTPEHSTFGTSGIAPIEALFNRSPVRLGGGTEAVSAVAWTAADGYDVDQAPSMRMVVDLGDLDASRWVNLTGQSGHPYHANYTDQLALWADGRTTPMRWDLRVIEGETTHRLVLEPQE